MDPITRKEMFLAKAGGQDVTTPTPVTREEIFLNEIAKGGGGSGGGPLVVTDTNGTLDKTWQEIRNAMLNGIVMVNVVDEGTLRTYIFSSTGIGEDKGGNPFYDASSIGFAGMNSVQRYYSTNSASGYPVLDPYA